MNKRKSMLEAARKSNRNTDVKSEDYKRLQIVVNTISRYLQIYDLDNGTVHSQVFTMLYTSDKYYTYNQICNTAHISKNTLIRYVAKYEQLALRISDKLNF